MKTCVCLHCKADFRNFYVFAFTVRLLVTILLVIGVFLNFSIVPKP